jgi:hypothetical protein
MIQKTKTAREREREKERGKKRYLERVIEEHEAEQQIEEFKKNENSTDEGRTDRLDGIGPFRS